jgi:surfactin synthase thioesterase subunit
MAQVCEAPSDAVVPLIEVYGAGRRFAYLGHSLGALVAHAVAARLEPDHLFVSAARAPGHALQLDEVRSPSTDIALDLLARLGGTPQEVLDDAELMDLLRPTLTADLELLEDAASRPRVITGCPIRTYGGTEDPLVSLEVLTQWELCTSGPFSIRQFPGDHFYLAGLAPELLADIASHLCPHQPFH